MGVHGVPPKSFIFSRILVNDQWWATPGTPHGPSSEALKAAKYRGASPESRKRWRRELGVRAEHRAVPMFINMYINVCMYVNIYIYIHVHMVVW